MPARLPNGLMARIGGFFGSDHKDLPESATALGLPNTPASAPVVPAVAGEPAQPPAAQPAEQPKKKRGFWGRLFGKRDKPDERKNDPPTPK